MFSLTYVPEKEPSNHGLKPCPKRILSVQLSLKAQLWKPNSFWEHRLLPSLSLSSHPRTAVLTHPSPPLFLSWAGHLQFLPFTLRYFLSDPLTLLSFPLPPLISAVLTLLCTEITRPLDHIHLGTLKVWTVTRSLSSGQVPVCSSE